MGKASFNKYFRRSLVTLVIHIALQNLISSATGTVDVVMLGAISNP